MCCSPSKVTTTSEVKLPKFIEEGGQDALDMARDIIAKPYQAFGGDKVADLTGRQTTAMGLLDNIMPSTLRTGSTGLDMSRIGEYMNPFTDEVINKVIGDITRGGAIQGEQMDNTFHAGGAFGDARQGAFDAEIGKNMASEIAGASSNLRSGAFSDALRTLMAEPGMEAQQMGNAYDYVRNLLGLGSVEQGQAQAETDAAVGDFNEARDYDKSSLDVLIRTLAGVPYGKTSTQTQPGPSTAGQIAGAGMNIASMFI